MQQSAATAAGVIAPPCELMNWDSEFFGFPVAKVLDDAFDPHGAAKIDAWCREHDVRWLNFVARPDDAQTVLLAGRRGYPRANIRTTYGRALSEATPAAPGIELVRRFDPRDVPTLMRIAAESHGD